jgi:hypothetical protein
MKCGQLAAVAPVRQKFHNSLAEIQFKQDGMRVAPLLHNTIMQQLSRSHRNLFCRVRPIDKVSIRLIATFGLAVIMTWFPWESTATFAGTNFYVPRTDHYYYSGFQWKLTKNPLQEIDELTSVLSENPGNVKAYYNRGLIKAQKGDIPGARADFARAAYQQPSSPEQYGDLCVVKWLFKAPSDVALKDCDQAIQANPQGSRGYYARGLVKAEAGKKSKQSALFASHSD